MAKNVNLGIAINALFLILILICSQRVLGSDINSKAWILSHQGNCYTAHLREAIKVNRARRSIYSKLTLGSSRTISDSLLLLDKIGLLFSKQLDSQGKVILGVHGFPLICEVIPSMLPTLSKPLKIGKPIPLNKYKYFPAPIVGRKIFMAYHQNGLASAHLFIKKYHEELNEMPSFNCLTRQFVRSMDRVIEINSINPSRQSNQLTWKLIQQSLIILPILAQLDRQALPIQMKGIPILCAEIPDLPKF